MAETDEEQLEEIKRWWDDNGTSTVTAVALGVAGVLGYQAWENNVRESGEAASVVYEDLVTATTSITPGNDDASLEATAKSLATTLRDEHAGTTYAVFASMHVAKLAVDREDYDTAVTELTWVLAQDIDQQLEVIVRLRLARVLLAQEKPEDALATVNVPMDSEAQKSSVEEVRGDIYVALGDLDQARVAYQAAVDSLTDDANKPLLTLKLADIPVRSSDTPAAAADSMDDAAPEAAEGDA